MSFYTPAGTKVLNLPEQVQKNLEDIAELKTLVGTKQDSSTAVTTANLKESVEAVGSFDLKDISTTSITNNGNLTNTGTADIEGDTNLGSNVEVDGNATLNSPENALFKTGSLDFSTLTSFIATYNNEAYQWLFARQHLVAGEEGNTYFNPSFSFVNFRNATRLDECFAYATSDIPIQLPNMQTDTIIFCRSMCRGLTCDDFYLGNGNFYGVDMFTNSGLKRVLVTGGSTPYAVQNASYMFCYSNSLTEIGAIDFSKSQQMGSTFLACPKLKSIHCTHLKWSFTISSSTEFEESDLVEIISNLDTVTTAQTLTMGSTNLAKLTEDEILVATGKGWTLA